MKMCRAGFLELLIAKVLDQNTCMQSESSAGFVHLFNANGSFGATTYKQFGAICICHIGYVTICQTGKIDIC